MKILTKCGAKYDGVNLEDTARNLQLENMV